MQHNVFPLSVGVSIRHFLRDLQPFIGINDGLLHPVHTPAPRIGSDRSQTTRPDCNQTAIEFA